MAGKGMKPAQGRNLPKWRAGYDQINWKPKPKQPRKTKKGLPDPYCTFCRGMGFIDRDYSITHCDCHLRRS